jgi:hypothetical protein
MAHEGIEGPPIEMPEDIKESVDLMDKACDIIVQALTPPEWELDDAEREFLLYRVQSEMANMMVRLVMNHMVDLGRFMAANRHKKEGKF